MLHCYIYIIYKYICIYIYMYIPSLVSLPPPSHPTPLSHQTAPGWAVCYIIASRWLSILRMIRISTHAYVNATFSIYPTLSFPHCVRKSILYVCICIPALQISSSGPFSRFHIYELTYDICFDLLVYCSLFVYFRM